MAEGSWKMAEGSWKMESSEEEEEVEVEEGFESFLGETFFETFKADALKIVEYVEDVKQALKSPSHPADQHAAVVICEDLKKDASDMYEGGKKLLASVATKFKHDRQHAMHLTSLMNDIDEEVLLARMHGRSKFGKSVFEEYTEANGAPCKPNFGQSVFDDSLCGFSTSRIPASKMRYFQSTPVTFREQHITPPTTVRATKRRNSITPCKLYTSSGYSTPSSVYSTPSSVDSTPSSVDSTPSSVESTPSSVDSTPSSSMDSTPSSSMEIPMLDSNICGPKFKSSLEADNTRLGLEYLRLTPFTTRKVSCTKRKSSRVNKVLNFSDGETRRQSPRIKELLELKVDDASKVQQSPEQKYRFKRRRIPMPRTPEPPTLISDILSSFLPGSSS